MGFRRGRRERIIGTRPVRTENCSTIRPHRELHIKQWSQNHNPRGSGSVVRDKRKSIEKDMRMESRMGRRVSVRKSNGHCPGPARAVAVAMVNGKTWGLVVLGRILGILAVQHQFSWDDIQFRQIIKQMNLLIILHLFIHI